jgi:hypothetical protein
MSIRKHIHRWTACFLLSAVLLAGCGSGNGPTPYPFATALPPPTYAITFLVRVPADTPSGDKVILNVLDEVTGLSLNPTRYEMQPLGPGLWQLTVNFPRSALVYYQYALQSGALEAGAGPGIIDYRTYYAAGNNQVEDAVAHWMGTAFGGTTGRLRGLVRDAATGNAIPGLLVTAAGQRTTTDTNGNFLINGVPSGKQTLVAFDMDGGYRPFVQEAIVADGQDTPANLLLAPVPRVTISFHLYVPADTPPGAPIRLVGGLYSLGNTYQSGPASTMVDATRAPLLTQLMDGTYLVALSLPIGTTFRYKFTMGDGFWNAERDSQGRFVLHDLIVPEHDTLVENGVDSWHSGTLGPVTFNVLTPASTPAGEYVSIQFSPFQGIWMRPIPMRSAGAQQWTFTLFSPLEWSGTVAYRYCRNNACGVADDAATAGETPSGRQFAPTEIPQIISDSVLEWVGLAETAAPQPAALSTSLRPDFRFGTVLSSARWSPPYDPATVDLKGIHAGTVFLSPQWYLGANAPLPEIRSLPEQATPSRQEVLAQVASIRAAGMKPALAPDLVALSGTTTDWWETAPRDTAWWDSFFLTYNEFLNTYADLAQQTGVEELVIARVSVTPALPGRPGTPADAEIRWRVLIRNIRLRYGGKLAVELPLTDAFGAAPAFLDEVDEILIRTSGPLTGGDNTLAGMAATAGALLDGKLADVRAFGKPILVEAAYASTFGADAGCPRDAGNNCLPLDALPPSAGLSLTLPVDFDAQNRAYTALLDAAAGRDWISGFLTWGYYPPAAMRDASPSVHGKPVESLLAAWFNR